VNVNKTTANDYEAAQKLPVRVVLENIRSGLNVGAFFRSGDAFRIESIELCGYTVHPPHRDILKSALGSSEYVPWNGHESAAAAIASLREQGFKIAAIEQTNSSIALHDWQPAPGESWALVFGNEVRGVESSTVDLCDTTIEIPQFGAKQSLNVSVCGGILLWEAARKMQFPY
jgi:23S rRNA (guanosine2251-2'-O)-methyltransferase